MGWTARLTDEAWADLKRLKRRDKKIHGEALKVLKQLESEPESGYELIGELAGRRSIHFSRNDDYRVAWSLDYEQQIVNVEGIGPKHPGFYDRVRARVRVQLQKF